MLPRRGLTHSACAMCVAPAFTCMCLRLCLVRASLLRIHLCLCLRLVCACLPALQGGENDLLERIARDKRFAAIHATLSDITDPSAYVGRAPEQVSEYLKGEVLPVLIANKELLSAAPATLAQVNV